MEILFALTTSGIKDDKEEPEQIVRGMSEALLANQGNNPLIYPVRSRALVDKLEQCDENHEGIMHVHDLECY